MRQWEKWGRRASWKIDIPARTRVTVIQRIMEQKLETISCYKNRLETRDTCKIKRERNAARLEQVCIMSHEIVLGCFRTLHHPIDPAFLCVYSRNFKEQQRGPGKRGRWTKDRGDKQTDSEEQTEKFVARQTRVRARYYSTRYVYTFEHRRKRTGSSIRREIIDERDDQSTTI